MDSFLVFILILATAVCTSPKSSTKYGCRYNSALCSKYELCVDDNLFGTCQNLLSESRVLQFRASDTLKKVLKFSLKSLLDLGYGWESPYTQCIVGGLLESYELYLDPDLTYCDDEEKSRLAAAALKYTHDAENPKSRSVSLNLYDAQPSGTGSAVYSVKDTTPLPDKNVLSKLSLADLEFIQKYLSVSRPTLLRETTSALPTASAAAASGNEGIELSDTDHWLLEQLVSEQITVDELTTSQIKRLKTYLQYVLSETTAASRETTPVGISKQEKTTPTADRVKSAEELKQEQAIRDILEEFTAESMNNKVAPRTINTESLNGDIIGQQISDELKQIQSQESTKYVDKKSRSKIVEAPDKVPEMTEPPKPQPTSTHFNIIDTSYVYLKLDEGLSLQIALDLVLYIADELNIPRSLLGDVSSNKDQVTFQVSPESKYNSTRIATMVQELLQEKIRTKYGVSVLSTGIGHSNNEMQVAPAEKVATPSNTTTIVIVVTVLVVIAVVIVMLVTWRCMYKRWYLSVNKFDKLSSTMSGESTQDSYEDLCRQRMQATNDDKAASSPPSDTEVDRVGPLKNKGELGGAPSERLRSPRSSTSSWSEEPVNLAMDISTGHTILNYMESHLKNTKRLEEEWTALESYTPDRYDVETGKLYPAKNRYPTTLPYDHNRVKLCNVDKDKGDDYINASYIADHDFRSPAYIVTQGPLQSTVEQFWQMVWEQECTSIVMLTSLAEDSKTVCYQYWPSDGREVYGDRFEVLLVSEHSWCEAYLIRSMYLKDLSTNQTRTVTQFHFLSWPISSVPDDCKDLLDFRRKVNKSYRGKTSPILVCCSDGSGRSGTYVLLDNIINRIHKGVKEIDIAASLEHIRDQRMCSIETKVQFEFTLSAIAEEVQALLKALP